MPRRPPGIVPGTGSGPPSRRHVPGHGDGFPARSASALLSFLVLGRHARRQQRRERYSIACLRAGIEKARRRIAARRLDDCLGQDVFPRGVDKTTTAGAEIGGPPTLLRISAADLIDGTIGPFGELLAVGQSIGPRDAAWPVVLVQRLNPEIDRARIALQRMRFHNARIDELEGGRQALGARPAEHSPGGVEAYDVKRADHDYGESLC